MKSDGKWYDGYCDEHYPQYSICKQTYKREYLKSFYRRVTDFDMEHQLEGNTHIHVFMCVYYVYMCVLLVIERCQGGAVLLGFGRLRPPKPSKKAPPWSFSLMLQINYTKNYANIHPFF